jgi:P2 family phage contractile tail tube protein
MAASLLVMESFNVICGDSGDASSPGVSTHLEVTNMKLPGLELNLVDHTAGGAPVQIEVPMFENKLESTFTLAGWNPGVVSMFGQWARALNRFTMYGLIRDRRSGQAMQLFAILEGQLGRANPQDARKNDLFQIEYAIRSIVHYELHMQETVGTEASEIMFWDFFTSTRRMGGVDLNAELNPILAIPSVAV